MRPFGELHPGGGVADEHAINKDFGSNYKYDVIMEESSITVE